MALTKLKKNKSVVFGRKKADSEADKDEDDTLDLLLHYARAGMEYAEKSLSESPDQFSTEERAQFEQNKNMLEQAPFLIKTYKSKIDEHKALHTKMMGILKKCEDIVSSGDDQARKEIKEVIGKAAIFSYDQNGNLNVTKNAS